MEYLTHTNRKAALEGLKNNKKPFKEFFKLLEELLYVKLADIIKNAVMDYQNEVKSSAFPTEKQSFTMDESILKSFE